MRPRLFKRYFLTTSVIIIFSLTAMMVIMTFVYNNHLAASNYKTLIKTCRTVADYSETVIKYGSPQNGIDSGKSIYFTAESLADVSDFDLFITDENGIVRVCTCQQWARDGSCEHSGRTISESFIAQVAEKDVTGLNTLDIYNNPHYVGATSIKSGSKTVGYVIASAPTSALKNLIRTVVKLYLLSAIVPIIIMFFALYAMTYRLTKPMKQMSEAARAMAMGDFSRRIPVTSDDEIGQLAASFNQMTDALVQLEGMRRSFVANVSHELKTPMTTIGGFIDGIIDGTIPPEKQEHYLGIVSGEVKRLSRLVQTMLDLSKLESGEFALKPEEFNFRELLLNIVLSQEQRIEKKNISICGLEETQNIEITADKDLIHQAIYNLVDNAVKFTNDGGTISFSLTAEQKNAVFSVTNTGSGIPQESLPLVFERFYKVDKSRSANKNGTGLGLYIVKTIIKNHGGNVYVSSVQNESTTFKVTLPLTK